MKVHNLPKVVTKNDFPRTGVEPRSFDPKSNSTDWAILLLITIFISHCTVMITWINQWSHVFLLSLNKANEGLGEMRCYDVLQKSAYRGKIMNFEHFSSNSYDYMISTSGISFLDWLRISGIIPSFTVLITSVPGWIHPPTLIADSCCVADLAGSLRTSDWWNCVIPNPVKQSTWILPQELSVVLSVK